MKYYFRVKMLLATFTLGVAGVYIFTDSIGCTADINSRQPTDFPAPPVVEFRAKPQPEDLGGGASGGVTCDEARARAKMKKKPFKDPNCE